MAPYDKLFSRPVQLWKLLACLIQTVFIIFVWSAHIIFISNFTGWFMRLISTISTTSTMLLIRFENLAVLPVAFSEALIAATAMLFFLLSSLTGEITFFTVK